MWVGAILSGLLGVMGCGDKEEAKKSVFDAPPIPTTQEAAAEMIRQEFKSAPPELQKNVDVAAQAIQTRDYEKATVGLYVLQAGAQTREQRLAVRQSMIRMQMDLANAIEAGDPKAKAAAEFMKRRSSGGR